MGAPVPVTPPSIALSNPSISDLEIKYVTDTLRRLMVSGTAPVVEWFERAFLSGYMPDHASGALAVSSGTAALHLALLTIGVGPGDEIIIPDWTFAAVGNAVLLCGASPRLVDVNRDGVMPYTAVRDNVSERTKAIIAVDLFGQCSPVWEYQRNGLPVICDCAENFRSWGAQADFVTYSFFANKQITTGEGGMLVCKSGSDAARAAIIRNHGRTQGYDHTVAGINYRMTAMQAALGLAQFERRDSLCDKWQTVRHWYRSHLPPAIKMHGHWLATVLVDRPDEVRHRLTAMGIETRGVFVPMHRMTPFANNGEYPMADWFWRHGLSLPTGPHLDELDVRFICSLIKSEDAPHGPTAP